MSVIYDAGLLIAAERNDRQVWADHRARLEMGLVPATTAPVVAQVSRSVRQVQLRRLLRGCDIVAFARQQAHEVGGLLARAGTSDVVDAHVVLIASEHDDAAVLTSDVQELKQLASKLSRRVRVQAI